MSISSEAIWAASPTNSSEVQPSPIPLSSDSKGERITYASGKSVFVRSIDDPSVSKQYTKHTSAATVARFAPSGFYIASGDVSGVVRVWDSVGAENTKGEYSIINGRINDIAWDGDSQRIIAVGNGKERYGHCITWDSGNSVGEISGPTKQVNCVSIRQQRPLRAATGSDDMKMCFFHGAPFKFNTSVDGKHTNFVYGAQFSPDGTYLATVGGDRKIWLYDGKTGEVLDKQIGEHEQAHKGSIFGVAWAKDSKRFVTCSADRTVKIWDVEKGSCTHTWEMGQAGSIADQQLGVTWPARSDDLIISVDREGNLNYFKASVPDKPFKVVHGHQGAITAAAYSPTAKTLWTGSFDGRTRAWDLSSGSASLISGDSHKSKISGIAASASSEHVSSVAHDDTLRLIEASQRTVTKSNIKTDGQPISVVQITLNNSPHTLVATNNGVTSYTSAGQVVSTQKLPVSPKCLAAHGSLVAVGSDDKAIRLFSASAPTDSSSMTELKDATAPISTLSFSADGAHLAAGCTNGKIFVYAQSGSTWTLETNRWSAHTARVESISWSPDGTRAVSGGLDTSVHVWSLADPGKRVKAMNAHKEGIGAVVWVDEQKVISCGADASVKVWKV